MCYPVTHESKLDVTPVSVWEALKAVWVTRVTHISMIENAKMTKQYLHTGQRAKGAEGQRRQETEPRGGSKQ